MDYSSRCSCGSTWHRQTAGSRHWAHGPGPERGGGEVGVQDTLSVPIPFTHPPPQKMSAPPSTATDCGSKKGHMPPLCAICMLSDSFGPKEQCFGMLLGNRMPSPKVPLKSRRGVLCSMQNNCPPPPPPNSTHTTQLKPHLPLSLFIRICVLSCGGLF